MNARKFLNVRVSFTVSALALVGAFAFAAMTTSCAGNGGGGGGSAGSGNGGNIGGGNGGNSGGTTGGGGAGTCSDPAADATNFCNGKAQGVLKGYAYIALGKGDTATDPKCAEDSTKPTVTRPITSADNTPSGACPTTGTTVWKASDSLCISGTVPPVVGSDYKGYWGLQIGVNTVDPPATAAGSGTLGTTYSTIALTTTGTISPTNQQIRVIIHVVNMAATAKNPDNNPYCATMSASGKVLNLTSFNTACWDPSTGDSLSASDIPNIDKIGIQISSDTATTYTVTDYCLTGIQFGK
jgi:hypothetical protein